MNAGNLTLQKVSESPGNFEPWDNKTLGSTELLDSFLAEFRSVYPLQISEADLAAVRAAARRALAVAEPATIIQGTLRYLAECTDREAHFIADPVHWLNGAKWKSTAKVKTSTVVVGQDGREISPGPLKTRDRILQWRPASASQTISLRNKKD